MRRAFVKSLIELAEADQRIFLLTGDLGWGVLEPFAHRFPDRFLNVGVAEQNLVGLATGLALAGYVPFTYSIATFSSMRCYEQTRNGPVLHHLPVRIVGVGGGYGYGHAGPTHYALEDLTLARVQPGMVVLAPADEEQVRSVVLATREIEGPVYLRLSKRTPSEIQGLEGRFRLDQAEIVRRGTDLLVVACGEIAAEALRAAELLEAQKVSAAVAVLAHLPFRPSVELVDLIRPFRLVISVEEAFAVGGLGSLLAEAIAVRGMACTLIVRAATKPLSCEVGSDSYMRARNGLDSRSIADAALQALGHP